MTGIDSTRDERELRDLANRVLALAVRARSVYTPLEDDPRLNGLEPVDLQVLVALMLESDQAVRDLAERLSLIPQTVSKSLRRLTVAGLVVDAGSAGGDQRERRRRLSPSGRAGARRFLVTAARRLQKQRCQGSANAQTGSADQCERPVR